MGVYIKNMEMPGSCFVCPVSHPAYYRTIGCGITGKTISAPECEEKRMESCPLISVPPHGRLIDEDEISKHKYATIPPYRKEYSDGKPKSEDEVIAFKFGWNDAIDAIVANAPTIIEAEEGE